MVVFPCLPHLLVTLRWTDPTAIAVAVAAAKDIALRTSTKCDERVPHVDPQLAGRHQERNRGTRDVLVFFVFNVELLSQ